MAGCRPLFSKWARSAELHLHPSTVGASLGGEGTQCVAFQPLDRPLVHWSSSLGPVHPQRLLVPVQPASTPITWQALASGATGALEYAIFRFEVQTHTWLRTPLTRGRRRPLRPGVSRRGQSWAARLEGLTGV